MCHDASSKVFPSDTCHYQTEDLILTFVDYSYNNGGQRKSPTLNAI